MEISTIRRLERWVGRPACALLTGHRRLRARIAGEEAPRPVERILFLKLIEQGSTVLACEALTRAVRRVGAENVYLLVFEENREIVEILDLLPRDNVLTIDAGRLRTLIPQTVRVIRRLRRLPIDAAIDMESFARAPALLAYLSGACVRVGLHRFSAEGPYRGDLMTHRVGFNPYLHTTDFFRLLLDAVDGDPGTIPVVKRKVDDTVRAPLPRFLPRPDERDRVLATLRMAGAPPGDGPIVLLNLNAADRLPLRRWPAERFVELGRRVLDSDPTPRVILTGTAGEHERVERCRAAISSPRAVNLAGRTSLRQAMVLYTLADVLVTNDSGPAHFASLTDIDVVVLFGPETPALYRPLGDRIHVLRAGLACSPCVSALNHRISPCRDNVCMQSIEVDDVFDVVRGVLDDRARRSAPV